jgi:hypothetical protein
MQQASRRRYNPPVLPNLPVARILSFLCLASNALLAWMVLQGYRVGAGAGGAASHIRFALFGLVVILFTHTMTLFYFVGTGSRIKKVVQEHGLAPELFRRTLAFKARLFPWLTFTPLVTMAAFIVGGAAHTRIWPAWIHGALALLSLGMNLITGAFALQCIASNVVLIEEVDAALPESALE